MPRRSSRVLSSVALGVVVAGVPLSGAQPPDAPAFEVASIKPNSAGMSAPSRIVIETGDRVTISNAPLRTIIQATYRLNDRQLIAGPGWIASERFDINAKADRRVPADQLRAMLQRLLSDRFKLAVHTETRDEPIYSLVVARRDRTLGPKMHTAAADCERLRAAARGGAPPGPNTAPCGMVMRPGHLAARGMRLGQIARFLSREAGRRVVDRTGLTGTYDWDVEFTPKAFLGASFDRNRFPNINPDGPSIFAAVQEQLGLKLEAENGEGTVLVIDHVERPTAN